MFLLFDVIILFKLCIQSRNDVSVIINRQITGRFVTSMFLKHLRFLALPITIGFSFSPDALQQNITVNRSFAILPPLHADFFCVRVLSERASFVTVENIPWLLILNDCVNSGLEIVYSIHVHVYAFTTNFTMCNWKFIFLTVKESVRDLEICEF